MEHSRGAMPAPPDEDKENTGNVAASPSVQQQVGPRKPRAWLSALVDATPQKSAAPAPRTLVQNQFADDVPSDVSCESAPALARPEQRKPARLSEPSPTQLVIRRRPVPAAAPSAPLRESAGTQRGQERPALEAQAKREKNAASSSSSASRSATAAWLSSPRGDWYCSSARAKVAAGSVGLSPMPLEEIM